MKVTMKGVLGNLLKLRHSQTSRNKKSSMWKNIYMFCLTKTWRLPKLLRTVRLLKLVQLATPALCHVRVRHKTQAYITCFYLRTPLQKPWDTIRSSKQTPPLFFFYKTAIWGSKHVFTPNDESTTSTLRLRQRSASATAWVWPFEYAVTDRCRSSQEKRCVSSQKIKCFAHILGVRAAIRGSLPGSTYCP